MQSWQVKSGLTIGICFRRSYGQNAPPSTSGWPPAPSEPVPPWKWGRAVGAPEVEWGCRCRRSPSRSLSSGNPPRRSRNWGSWRPHGRAPVDARLRRPARPPSPTNSGGPLPLKKFIAPQRLEPVQPLHRRLPGDRPPHGPPPRRGPPRAVRRRRRDVVRGRESPMRPAGAWGPFFYIFVRPSRQAAKAMLDGPPSHRTVPKSDRIRRNGPASALMSIFCWPSRLTKTSGIKNQPW